MTKYGPVDIANLWKHRIYKIWYGMMERCTNPKAVGFEDYGGAGIKVCPRWTNIRNFLDDMGSPPKGHSIDRIDSTKGYEPGNCRWATPKQQANNRYNNSKLTVNGVTMTCSQWADKTGIPRWKIWDRKFEKGFPDELCISKGNLRRARPPTHAKFITAFGRTMRMMEWAEALGITSAHIQNRINTGNRGDEECIRHFILKTPESHPLRNVLRGTL